jgi:hypothetical protein
LAIKTDDTTHIPRSYEKIYKIRKLSGRLGQAPKQVQKWLEGTDWVLLSLEGRIEVRVSS